MRSRLFFVLGSMLLVLISIFSIAFSLKKQKVISAEEKAAADVSEQVAMNCGIGGI